MKKRVLIAGIVIVAVAAAVVIPRMTKKEVEAEAPVPVVKVQTPEYATIELQRDEIGSVEPSDIVYQYPKMSGEIDEVHAATGDVVEEGQLLCVIDTKQVETARLNVEAAQTSLQDAQTNYNRQQELYAAGDISSLAWEQAQTGLKNAQIQYDSAKVNYDNQMEDSFVTATIGGRVESFDVELHDNVSPQNRICVIAGEGSKAITFYVTEKVVRNLNLGDDVVIEKSGMDYDGVISEISSMIDNSTGLFKVKASVEDGDALPTGATVKLYVTSDKAENTMSLPVDAVYYSGGDAYVYTYDNGTVHQVPVEVGIYDAERIQILSGITMDDQVITTWSSELFEGSVVKTADASVQEETDASDSAMTE